ncbi:MAG: tandem-95 repeat protein, partial [Sandarakinorhabdus sp.]|nr:tandem-95 repeat protein [Sandarakinorhabdus sp.]
IADAAAINALTAAQTPTATFTFVVTDASGATDSKTLTVSITGANDAPVATNDPITTAEDTPVTFEVRTNDSDVDGDALTVTQINGTAITTGGSVAVTGGTVTLNANGTLTFTPAANYNGTPSFGYTVSDGKGGTATANVNLTVTSVNDAPSEVLLTPANGGTLLSVVENVVGAVIGPVRALDPDLGDVLRLSVDDTRFEIVGGLLKLREGVSLDFEAARSVSVAITATDPSGLSRTQSFTIIVIDVNEPSIARSDSYVLDGGTTLSVPAPTGVLANDSDPEGASLTAQIVAGPSNGQLTLNANGSFTYAPNAGFAGTDSFTYRAQDGSAAPGVATVTLTVRAVPVPEIIVLPPVIVAPPVVVPVPVVVAPVISSSPLSPFAPPSIVATSPASALPALEAYGSLISSLSITAVFTDPGGFQLMVLPGGGDALVLFRGVPDQSFTGPGVIRFSLPVDAFAHTRTDRTVKVSAMLVSNRPLPSWLTFNSSRGFFEGVAPENTNTDLAIKVIARDNNGKEAVAIFRVKVNNTGVTQNALDTQSLKGQKIAQRQVPQLLRDSRIAQEIRGKAARLAGRA